jgi:KaiC/GvpD/RAD55 family RecA-like ATPase
VQLIHLYLYDDSAKEYFKEHGDSIKGYTGKAWTETLYWDLDCEGDFEKVRDSSLKLLHKLEELDFADSTQIYFSGHKGVHIFTHTSTKFNPEETRNTCYNLAMEAGVDPSVLDTSVYNVNRIFRIENTKHQKSGLYKVELYYDELSESSLGDIKTIASGIRTTKNEVGKKDAGFIKKRFSENTNRTVQVKKVSEITAIHDFDVNDCPKDKRTCIYILENGYFGHGERENGLMRLAAYYRGKGIDRDQALAMLNIALERREQIYDKVNQYSDEDTIRCLDQVYSEGWNNGMYSCKNDLFLQQKCDEFGAKNCHAKKEKVSSVLTIDQVCDNYIKYGEEALREYPKSGLEWLDNRVRIRPRNYSMINGSCGSGKTSLAIVMMEHFNEQGIRNIFFSLDMADSSLFEKLGARYTKYSPEEIEYAFNVNFRNDFSSRYSGDATQVMEEVISAIKEKFPLTYFDFTATASSKYVLDTIKNVNETLEDTIKVGFIDYAGRLVSDQQNAYANSSYNARMANDIVKANDIHMIYISQIARENGDHTSALRTSRVAKESGAWEENATFVLNCWRPYGDGLTGEDKYFHLYVAKNRSGSLGEHVFRWEGAKGDIIDDLSNSDYQEYIEKCKEDGKPLPPGSNGFLTPPNKRRRPINQDESKDDGKQELQYSKDSTRFKRSSDKS